MIELHNCDCMEYMAKCEDNAFELAIVDPPYGIGMPVIEVGKWKRKIHDKRKNWDEKIPDENYFIELDRISANRIIWGGNYFIEYLHNTPCFIFWDKKNGDNFMSDGELAWCFFKTRARRFVYNHIQEYNSKIKRIHPTQKPVELYRWLLKNYAKPGDRILDTHLGSGSIAIACNEMGFDLVGCELDKDYFDAAKARIAKSSEQGRLF